ncbi:class D sortase [Anoxybacteroides amylolyticum]|uniref:Sortase family protein n=1 Tax=Anoxybacteroides amylolyticum TaxID=294699 RepID=A0A167T4D2_9BACL|nr:class D sortase [Anoxybacillus amylolyticus]ANB59434.1 sortase family protein [Anoxybacillus amylolyticus]
MKKRFACLFSAVGICLISWNGYWYWQGVHATVPTTVTAQGAVFGKLTIPKLSLVLPIYEGTTETELKKGVGHELNSALPGEAGNVVLSGHRDTVFRKLGQVRVGDELVVETAAGRFGYVVKKVRIVSENDRTVLVDKPRPTLTVTTCYPFQFIGDAKQRYVLVAHLASVHH